jgi:acyl carrier protein
MVPARIVVTERLPLTPNGKVDRRRLAATDVDLPAIAHVAPTTAAERVVARVFGAALGIDGVGVRTSFFELGGHSIAATQLLARLRDLFQVQLPLRDVFETPTVEGVVAALGRAWRGLAAVEEIALTIEEIEREDDVEAAS